MRLALMRTVVFRDHYARVVASRSNVCQVSRKPLFPKPLLRKPQLGLACIFSYAFPFPFQLCIPFSFSHMHILLSQVLSIYSSQLVGSRAMSTWTCHVSTCMLCICACLYVYACAFTGLAWYSAYTPAHTRKHTHIILTHVYTHVHACCS